VTSDDEVMRVLERADPARVDELVLMIDAAEFLDALHTGSTTVALDVEPAGSGRRRHRWQVVALAAAAVVAVFVGAIVLAA
jgi:hypothetical protein